MKASAASGASDASYSGKVSIESVGHADGDEHRVRAARVRDRSTSDDQRLHACLALLNGVLRATTVHMDDVCPGSSVGVNRVTSELADAAVCLTRDDHCAFALAANSKRKALEAVTAMARYRHPKPGGRDTNIYAIRASCIIPMVLNGWRMYIHRCVSAREGDPFHRAYDDEKSRRRSAAERRSSTETFYRDAPAFDDRLTAADVGLALRDAAELFEMDDAETGSEMVRGGGARSRISSIRGTNEGRDPRPGGPRRPRHVERFLQPRVFHALARDVRARRRRAARGAVRSRGG